MHRRVVNEFMHIHARVVCCIQTVTHARLCTRGWRFVIRRRGRILPVHHRRRRAGAGAGCAHNGPLPNPIAGLLLPSRSAYSKRLRYVPASVRVCVRVYSDACFACMISAPRPHRHMIDANYSLLLPSKMKTKRPPRTPNSAEPTQRRKIHVSIGEAMGEAAAHSPALPNSGW